jgi:hypothetical protein
LLVVFGLALAVTPAVGSVAATPPAAVAEIRYLLEAMGSSGCQFYRNGSWNSPAVAQEHLRGKYERLVAKGSIQSAEDFIVMAATRSSVSGRAYAVQCAGALPTGSDLWLGEQLRRYRAGATPAAGAPRDPRAAPAPGLLH